MSASDHSRAMSITQTNEKFLQANFRNQRERALVAWFRGDPSRGSQDVNWAAKTATMLPPEVEQRELNMYFSPSLFRGTLRREADFVSFHVIVFDDYGTKVPAGKPEAFLGKPSYLIETSPGNFQAGWICDPLTDLTWVKGMLEQLRAAVGSGDNLTDPTIWRRLPVGINGKPEHYRGSQVWRLR